MSDSSFFVAFMGIMGIFWLLMMVVIVGLYVIGALGTVYILKRCEYQNSWFGWIPYLNTYALAQCVQDEDGQITLGVGNVRLPAIVVGLSPLISIAVSMIPVLGSLLTFAISILVVGTLYGLVYAMMEGKDYSETKAIGFASGFIGIIFTVKAFLYRKNGI